jgi:hypothetical protein
LIPNSLLLYYPLKLSSIDFNVINNYGKLGSSENININANYATSYLANVDEPTLLTFSSKFNWSNYFMTQYVSGINTSSSCNKI